MLDFHSSQRFDGDMGELFLCCSEEAFVVLNAPIGVESTDRVHFVNGMGILLQISEVLLDRHGVGIGCFWAATEGTKFAGKYTDIGLVDVDI